MNKIVYSLSNPNGFRNIENFDDDFGLLFKHSGAMVMDKVSIPLTAIFLDSAFTIVDKVNMTPEPYAAYPAIKYASHKKYSYVLEIKQAADEQLNWGVGDELSIDDTSIQKEEPVNFIATAVTNCVMLSCKYGDEEWMGSGFLISNMGHIMTCAHVVSLNIHGPFDKQTVINVSFDGAKFFPARVLAINYDMDVAVLKIPQFQNLVEKVDVFLPLGSTKGLDVGSEIVVVSTLDGIENIVTSGIISSDSRSAPDVPAPVLFIDVRIDPGSSGGAVISKTTGEIVGIARGSMSKSDSETAAGVNYCISIDDAKKWLEKIKVKIKKFANKDIKPKDLVIVGKSIIDILKIDIDDNLPSSFTNSAKALIKNPGLSGIVIDVAEDHALVKIKGDNYIIPTDKLKATGIVHEDDEIYSSDEHKLSVDKNNLTLILSNKGKIVELDISAGKEGWPTYKGKFKILEKEDMPYEKEFDQYLPFWLGFNPFYNILKRTGCIQGFHSVPTDKDKNMIDEPIKQNNSHGCIRLLLDDAEKIYNMCEVGDSVEIR